jgi:hypothetical protein
MAKIYNTSVLSVYDENRNKIDIPAIKGKSAYEYAKDSGYTGSEEDYARDCNPDNFGMGVSEHNTSTSAHPDIRKRLGEISSELATVKNQIASGVTYTNVLPTAINADGTEYVGDNGEDGYKVGYRLATATGLETTDSGYCCTGFIKVQQNDVIRIKGIATNSYGAGSLIFFQSDRLAANRLAPIYE